MEWNFSYSYAFIYNYKKIIKLFLTKISLMLKLTKIKKSTKIL